jgi:hypothetical protein
MIPHASAAALPRIAEDVAGHNVQLLAVCGRPCAGRDRAFAAPRAITDLSRDARPAGSSFEVPSSVVFVTVHIQERGEVRGNQPLSNTQRLASSRAGSSPIGREVRPQCRKRTCVPTSSTLSAWYAVFLGAVRNPQRESTRLPGSPPSISHQPLRASLEDNAPSHNVQHMHLVPCPSAPRRLRDEPHLRHHLDSHGEMSCPSVDRLKISEFGERHLILSLIHSHW